MERGSATAGMEGSWYEEGLLGCEFWWQIVWRLVVVGRGGKWYEMLMW